MSRLVRAVCLSVVTVAAIPAVAALAVVWALYRLADKIITLTERR